MAIDAASRDRHRGGRRSESGGAPFREDPAREDPAREDPAREDPAREDPAREDPADIVSRLLVGGRPAAALPPAGIAGIEQEYEVRVDGTLVDFADLIERVAPAGASRRFAFDAQARIVRSGAVWTVDAPHAEVATPPRELGLGIASRLADDALTERDALRRRLIAAVPGHVELRGYSTHLNAYADDVDGWALVGHVAVTYAPALMLLAERPSSPGLLVRPRPRRLEIGTEYLESREDLIAAAVLVLATAVAAWPVGRGDAQSPLPALDGSRLQTTWQRPGWFVPRDAFGEDLYRLGRAARLRLAGGSTVAAGERLAQTWEHLRPLAAAFATGDELALVDDLVAGRLLLPMERGLPSDPLVRRVPRRQRASASTTPPVPVQSVLAVRPRTRGRLRLSPEAITWDQAVLRVSHPARTFYLAVPREAGQQFEAAWASGALDAPLAAFAAGAPTDRVAVLDQARAGVFDAVEPAQFAAERLQSTKPHAPRQKPRPPLVLPAMPMALPPVPPVPPLPAQPVAPPVVLEPPGQPPAAIPLPPVEQPPLVQRPIVPPGRLRPPWQRPPVIIGLIGIIVVVVLVLVGIPALNRQPTGTASPSESPSRSQCLPGEVCAAQSASAPVSPSASGCIPGVACGSPSPSASPSASALPSPSASQCVPGQVCGSPSPAPTPTASPAPTPTPTPRPTPDRTGPSITGLRWKPPLIGVQFVGNQCAIDPTTATVIVTVTDPSGILSVALNYRRPDDASTQSVPMSHATGGIYSVVLNTAVGANWSSVNGTYVIQLGVSAKDKAGNVRTLSLKPGFTVEPCK